MQNRITLAAIAAVLGALVTGEAHAIAINKCVSIIRDRQVSRETIVNRCGECRTVKVERQRPGSASGVPSLRTFTLPPGAAQPLPFRGPGSSRISADMACRPTP